MKGAEYGVPEQKNAELEQFRLECVKRWETDKKVRSDNSQFRTWFAREKRAFVTSKGAN